MIELKYGHILLRQAASADVKQLTAWWNDGRVMAHAGFPNGLGITEAETAALLNDGWLVIEESGRRIGEACFKKAGEGAAAIGIKICETDCQNRGIGRIVLSLLIRYLFDQGFLRIVLDTNLENLRAQHVYESLGFQKLRVSRDSWVDQLGNRQSSVEYALTESDFIDFVHADRTFEAAYRKLLDELGRGKPMVLSTSADGHVTSRMMSIVCLDGMFYFQTDRTFRKYAQLMDNPRAALCADNVQIEGVCEEIGHPSQCAAFSEAYRTCFAGSYERYSNLTNERVFVLRPMAVQRWVYRGGEPFIEMFDAARRKYACCAYQGE